MSTAIKWHPSHVAHVIMLRILVDINLTFVVMFVFPGDVENRQNPMVVGFYGGNKQSGQLPGYFKGYIDNVSI